MLLFKNVCWGLLLSRSVPGSSDTKGNRIRSLPLSSMFCWTVNSSQQRLFFVHHCSLITDHCCLKEKLSLKWGETPVGWGRRGWSPHRSSSEKTDERTDFRGIPELRHRLWNRKDNGENTDRMNRVTDMSFLVHMYEQRRFNDFEVEKGFVSTTPRPEATEKGIGRSDYVSQLKKISKTL